MQDSAPKKKNKKNKKTHFSKTPNTNLNIHPECNS